MKDALTYFDLLKELESMTPEQLRQPVVVATPQGIIECMSCSVIEADSVDFLEDQLVLETFIY